MADEPIPPPLRPQMLRFHSTSSARGGFGLSILNVDEPSVEHSFEITATALRMKGYEINANGISQRPSDLHAIVESPHPDPAMFVPFGAIGKGASGTVSKALRVKSCEVFALKSIGVHVQAQRHQLVKELDTYASVKNQYIVNFHGAFYSQGSTMLILDYMNRGSLQQVIDVIGPLPEIVLQRISKQVVTGLHAMHSQRKLHRDIKPGNILLNSAGEAKLADFGIVKELGAMTNAQTFVGTQVFMSPERIQSQPYGTSADIWSFGLTLATCASGRFPYSDADKGFIHVFQSITKDPPPVLPKSRFSVGLRNFVSKCLIKDPEQRWSTERLLAHPWLSDVDITKPYRWPWDQAATSPGDLDDLSRVAALLKEVEIVPTMAQYQRLARSLNLPIGLVQKQLFAASHPQSTGSQKPNLVI